MAIPSASIMPNMMSVAVRDTGLVSYLRGCENFGQNCGGSPPHPPLAPLRVAVYGSLPGPLPRAAPSASGQSPVARSGGPAAGSVQNGMPRNRSRMPQDGPGRRN